VPLSSRLRVLLFDPRGAGETPDPGTPFGPDELAGDVLAVLDAAGAERADLVGHSLGAHVALLVAARWPDRVRRVVAIGPALWIDAYLASVMDVWEAAIRSSIPDHGLHQLVTQQAFGRAAFARLVPAVVREMDARPIPRPTMLRYVDCDRRQDLRGFVGRIDAPVLVLCGTEDALPGTGQARLIAEAVPGARLELLEAAGHSPQIEAAPAVNRLLAAFLSG
jgi:pimeloyl-ACP methyl ester carboxylesterase